MTDLVKTIAQQSDDEVILLYCDDPDLLHPKSRLFGHWTRLYLEDGVDKIQDILNSAPEDASVKVIATIDCSEKVYRKCNGEWHLWYERYQYDGVILPRLPEGLILRWDRLIPRKFVPVESEDDVPVGGIVTCQNGITYTHCTKLSGGMWWLSGKEVKHWEATS